MKKHLLSLFDPSHRNRTIVLITTALVLIIASQFVGITDNLPGILMLLTGIILLFFSILHPWRKVENYAKLIGVCLGVIVLVMGSIYILSLLHKTQYISEGVTMAIIFIFCVPGILVGVIGTIYLSIRNK
jgi:hypothetical protein